MTDKKQKVVEAYEYDSFGNLKQGFTLPMQLFTYAGRIFDVETGLYDNRARTYDSSSGRFVQKDPIGFNGGDVNLYAYVQNNPVNWRDPRGLYGEDVHYHLTLNLAGLAGFNSADTTSIAAANQSVDDDWISNPFNYPGGTKLHFMTQISARELIRNAIDSGNLGAFGVALHIFQDTFSHAGFSWKTGHIFAGTTPDNFSYYDSRDRDMMDNTKYYLDLMKRMKCKK